MTQLKFINKVTVFRELTNQNEEKNAYFNARRTR